jgi:hypothetical protein
VTRAADTALGWSLAAAAWTVHLAVYPAMLAHAYLVRASWPAFQESLELGVQCFAPDEERAA